MTLPASWAAADSGRRFIWFDFDTSELTERARDAVRGYVATWNGRCPVRLWVTGHVDGAEARAARVTLDIERAQAVAGEFKLTGTPAWTIDVGSKNFTAPLVETALDQREPQNRRVELRFAPMIASGRVECALPQQEIVAAPECVLIMADGTRCTRE